MLSTYEHIKIVFFIRHDFSACIFIIFINIHFCWAHNSRTSANGTTFARSNLLWHPDTHWHPDGDLAYEMGAPNELATFVDHIFELANTSYLYPRCSMYAIFPYIYPKNNPVM